MGYRVVIPRAAGAPVVEPATSASEAITKLTANRMLFGDAEVYVERDNGQRVRRAELKRERASELSQGMAASAATSGRTAPTL